MYNLIYLGILSLSGFCSTHICALTPFFSSLFSPKIGTFALLYISSHYLAINILQSMHLFFSGGGQGEYFFLFPLENSFPYYENKVFLFLPNLIILRY